MRSTRSGSGSPARAAHNEGVHNATQCIATVAASICATGDTDVPRGAEVDDAHRDALTEAEPRAAAPECGHWRANDQAEQATRDGKGSQSLCHRRRR